MEETSRKVDGLAESIHPQHFQFRQECVEETLRLWHLSVPVVSSARKELDLPLDEDVYRGLVEESVQRLRMTITAFEKKISGGAEDPTSPSA